MFLQMRSRWRTWEGSVPGRPIGSCLVTVAVSAVLSPTLGGVLVPMLSFLHRVLPSPSPAALPRVTTENFFLFLPRAQE